MRIAVIGCSGSVGSSVVRNAIAAGHRVLGLDFTPPGAAPSNDTKKFVFGKVDARDFDRVLSVLRGFETEGVVHLAAHRNPTDYLAKTHNDNVVMSWNVLRACAEVTLIFRIEIAGSHR